MANDQIDHGFDREFDFTLSDEAIIELCVHSPIICESELRSRVFKITKNTVVKISMNVSANEAANQTFVSKNADLQILLAPRVFRFFKDESRRYGYLVMEYIDSIVLETLDAGQRSNDYSDCHCDQAFTTIACPQRSTSWTPWWRPR